MIQLIVFDFDGTLVPKDVPNVDIDNKTLQSIFSLQKKGVRFMIATGRHPSFIFKRIHTISFDRIVGYSGNIVYQNEIYEPYIFHKNEISSFYHYINMNSDSELTLYSDEAVVYCSTKKKQEETRKRLLNAEQIIVDVNGVSEYLVKDYLQQPMNPTICRICIRFQDWNQYENRRKEFEKTFPGYRLVKTGGNQAEVLYEERSKASEILRIAKDMGISKEEVATIGDDENDYEMLKLFPYSFYVGEDNIRLEKAATYRMKDCKEALDYILKNNGVSHV